MSWMEQSVSPIPLSTRAADSAAYSSADRQRDIFDSHRHHVYSVAYYMTGNELEAEKILEGSFVHAFQAAAEATGTKPADARPGIEQIDRGLLAELMRRFTLAPPPSAEQSVNEADTSAAGPMGNVRRTDLEEAIWGLPDEERLLFLLRDVEGYAPERIAELLTWPLPTVRKTLLMARLHLRQQLALRAVGKA